MSRMTRRKLEQMDKCWMHVRVESFTKGCTAQAVHYFQGGSEDFRTGKWCEEHWKLLERVQERKEQLQKEK